EGTGLGLSISKQLVTLMGGSIGVESEFGKGSEFYFIIPQKIIHEKPAAQIVEKNRELTVGGRWKNPYMAEEFDKLVRDYAVEYKRDLPASEVDFFFTDDEAWVKQDAAQELIQNGAAVYLLQNPMLPDSRAASVTMVNKPLYSLNFCQIMNREETGGQFSTEDYINFRAPEASVLLVDDNEMNRIVAVSLLEPIQMQIDTAENGKDAVEKIMGKHYDLVLMDHMMPVMDGIEATRQIRSTQGEYYQSLPIIALTANAMSDARKKFVEVGMSDFVAKPIELKEICAKIKHWLPDEKIQKRIPQPEDEEKRKAEESIVIPDIEGLDKAEGVKNSGSKELFLQLLGDFYRLIDVKSNKIEKCLADGMIRDYTIEVHAMKNTARMIGAMELSQLFYEMEQYGNEENVEALQRETPKALTLYRSYKEILKPFAKESDGKKEEIPPQELIWKLEMLGKAVLDFDLDTADDVMEELERVCVPEECAEQMEQLRIYYADLAMDEITKVCESMVTILKNM
ncbi:MAG: response regulator, partial [Butyrivibrio sp.]|nr:response regulator [Butyrivibrio sp.]